LRLTETPELADVPWEFLHNATSNQFLSLSPDTPLVRYLDLPLAARPLAVTPPIRVLVMISSPTDFPQLDVAAEWDRLNSALHDLIERGLVSLTRLPSASLGSLQRPLRLSQYHIFHFIGHGGFDEQAQDGALLLEDARGRGRLVSGQDLGVMLTGHRSLRLVILNACEGARSSSSDPFAGVAQTLIQQAIPAVIAMQFEITDDAAITFAHEFYGAVADGYPVDAALAESRRAIFAQGNEFEWATPVLYMRSPNGQLFRLARTSPEALQEAAERQVREQAEKEAAEQRAREQAERQAREQVEPAKAAEVATALGQVSDRPSLPLPGRRLRTVLGSPPARTALLPVVASLLLVGGALLPFADSNGEAKYLWDAHASNVVGPLAAALLVAFAGLRSRPGEGASSFLDGILIGTGVSMLFVFIAYSATGDTLCGDLCGLIPHVGVFAGMAGGALALAAGLARERKRTAASLPEGSSTRRRAATAVLALAGGVVLILATFSSSLVAGDPKTIFRALPPFSLPPLAVAVIGLAAPIGLVAAPSRRGVVPGVLVGAGVEAFLFFAVLNFQVSSADYQLGVAPPLGLIGGALLVAGGVLGRRRPHRADVSESSSADGLGLEPPSRDHGE
jgi:CHAT domain